MTNIICLSWTNDKTLFFSKTFKRELSDALSFYQIQIVEHSFCYHNHFSKMNLGPKGKRQFSHPMISNTSFYLSNDIIWVNSTSFILIPLNALTRFSMNKDKAKHFSLFPLTISLECSNHRWWCLGNICFCFSVLFVQWMTIKLIAQQTSVSLDNIARPLNWFSKSLYLRLVNSVKFQILS